MIKSLDNLEYFFLLIDNIHNLQLLLTRIKALKGIKQSIDMFYKALIKLSTKNFVPKIIETFGKVFTLPNLKQWLILNIKVLLRNLK